MALSTQRAFISLPSADQSAPPQQKKHDVFLSFRGEDTRNNFISHLYHELQYVHHIETFKDETKLQVGTNISSALLNAIQDSELAIVVLSPQYASSTWCLDELTHILRYMGDKAKVMPIFYDVEPSDVRKQRGSFEEAFAQHRTRFTEDMVKKWSDALKQVTGLSGKANDQKCNERKLIEDIVQWVRSKVPRTLLLNSKQFVGIKTILEHEQVNSVLAPNADDVQFTGIYGIGGIGKTTTAKLIYDNIADSFDVSIFLEDVKDHTLVDLKKRLLLSILKKKLIEQLSSEELLGTDIKRYFGDKKVLLILDDVNESSQLENLAGEKDWFGKGSKIIITTRNKRLLDLHDHVEDKRQYQVKALHRDKALELFCRNAFRKAEPKEGFLALSESFLDIARGHPLALKTLGSYLYKRDQDAWNSALVNMKESLHPTIFYCLKVSYEGLEEMEKMCFLDIACFYRGEHKEEVIDLLDRSRGNSSHIHICTLVEKSLLEYNSNNTIGMHDLIQEMAWNIEKSKEPGKRTRLWELDDIFEVFMMGSETAIEAISLRLRESEKICHFNFEAFCNMTRLRLLRFDNMIFPFGPDCLPNSLRILIWSWYPSEVLPQKFQPHFLIELDMSWGKLVRLWDGRKDLPNLKLMNLEYSTELISTPDVTGLPNLEKLDFSGCKKLVEIHPSIAFLKKLKKLDFSYCESIESLPRKIEMDSLEDFDLSGCSKLKKIPEFVEKMPNLLALPLRETPIKEIPASIECLVGLQELNLFGCKNLMGLPSEICNLKSLTMLVVTECSKLEKLPENLGNLRSLVHLYLDYTAVRELPASLVRLNNLLGLSFCESVPKPLGLVLPSLDGLCSLKILTLEDCNVGIPDDIGCLSSLESLHLSGKNFVSLPASIRCLPKLKHLDLRRCKSLEELPDLPPTWLRVYVDECTSLQRLSDPSKWSSSFPSNLYDFSFTSLNCISLVEDEDIWNNRIFSSLIRWAHHNELLYNCGDIVSPRTEIPALFNNQSVGDSVKVELPPPSCTNWMGIAFCVVFEGGTKLKDLAALCEDARKFKTTANSFGIRCSSGVLDWRFLSFPLIGHPESEHHWVFYLPRNRCRGEQFLFEAYYDKWDTIGKLPERVGVSWLNIVKKCGARLVYKDELRKLNEKLKILKPTHEYFCAEAGPSGSRSFDDTEEPPQKRLKQYCSQNS